MATRDPAFLWETEILRSSTPNPGADRASTGTDVDHSDDWLTLREASEVTGVPTSTIRKWAKQENIPSYLERGTDGFVRLVSMTGIGRWADQIGREIDTPDPETAPPPPPSPKPTVDLTDDDAVEPAVPEGSMLVPLDAWNRMLNQLGNLHEAGQQLAEARERAAKAETESLFLKERLADLREELERAKEATAADEPSDEQGAPPPSHGATASGPASATSLVRKAYRSWRDRRRDRA